MSVLWNDLTATWDDLASLWATTVDPGVNAGRRARYEAFIDWDNDGGLDVGRFEAGVDSWVEASGITSLDVSTSRAHSGDQSLLVIWDGAASPSAIRSFPTTAGRTYTLTGWVWVPVGSPAVKLSAAGVDSSASTLFEDWEELSVSFTAAASSTNLTLKSSATPDAGDAVWLDEVMLLGVGENVTDNLLAVRSNIDIEYGRDLARSLADVRPGDCAFELNNISRDYTPDNASSPLVGFLEPGKTVLIRATHASQSYVLFRGYLDSWELKPDKNERSVAMTAVDVLTRLQSAKISTDLWPSLQTGEALHKVLDAAGWPASARDIDTGATTVRWWWEEGTPAWEACQKLMRSEGPPAFCSVDGSGRFVFRDRHHRLQDAGSITSQQTFNADGDEPVFSPPFAYDIGWKDLINDFSVVVDERQPHHEDEPGYITRVFETTDRYVLSHGETRTITVKTEDPFYNAVVPVKKDLTDDDFPKAWDYELITGDVTVTLTRTSGQTCGIVIHANTASIIQGMGLRATSVPVVRSYAVSVQDSTSIAKHGVKSYDGDVPFAGRWDAEAIGQTIVGLRSRRMPTVTFTLKNANATRMREQLRRDISERVTIVEPESGVNGEFFIEKITHRVNDAGHDHQTDFACELAENPITSVFTFGVSGKGFDEGAFGTPAAQSPEDIFILGESLLDQQQLAL
jgi:hypothetical protein